jgi:Flp pilus assembly protein TadD
MCRQRFLQLFVVIASTALSPSLFAGDLAINLPRRSSPTPVQRLNQEGVEAIRKNHYDKAEELFYKAYLYDPADPFTLNNLGYISELQGQIDRAQKFYDLASQQASNAVISRSSSQKLEGKPMRDAVTGLHDASIQVNRDNVEAIRLLSEGRAHEADDLLQQDLTRNPRNAFTLNNMGVTKEEEGDLEGALRYYTAAADLHSEETVVVTLNVASRGLPVSKLAADSAKKVSDRMHAPQNAEVQANLLNLRGVAAINRNDWSTAEQDFRRAYALSPQDAFSINNAGYLAEMGGDAETAQFFYDKARKAEGADSRVGLASRRSLERMRLFQVADDNDQKIEDEIDRERAARQRQTGPIELKRRDNKPVDEPSPAAPQSSVPKPPAAAPPPQP